MKVAYVVSMFPCWSETFILNELVSHQQAGLELSIFSLKNSSESIVHDEAMPFIDKTEYGERWFSLKLLLLHLLLFFKTPLFYSKILCKLLFMNVTEPFVKAKALGVFFLSPTFISSARQRKIDHLHAHFATYPALLAWLVGRFTKIPYTFTAHAHDIYVNQDLLPIICEDAAAIVTISEFNKNFIAQKIGSKYCEKIEVIHCGINLNKFRYEPNRVKNTSDILPLSILSIGRLSGIKGFYYLVEALRLLKNDGIAFYCNIIGDGPLKAKLLQQVKDADLDKMVHFLGSTKSDKIPAYLKEADVFVLACARDKIEGHDGIPMVFMEAMAYGVPVIGTSLSGIPELIKHGETGLCANPGNAVDIKEKIRYFISNPDKADLMRQKARKLIEDEFDITLSCNKLRELFRHKKHLKSQRRENRQSRIIRRG